ARILTGGERDGSLFQPTIVAGADERMRISCEEVFAPVVDVYEFGDTLEALDRAGASEFGLQAGLFTNDLRVVDAAFERIEVGGLMVNDVATFRVDHMPYAIEEMTELKLLTYNPRPL